MDLEQTGLRGYVFVPYCTDECCQNQLQGFQAVPSSYPTSASKCNPFLPEQISSNSLATHASRFTSLKTGAYRVLFPAISRERSQPSEVSRHKVDVKRLLSTFQPIQGISSGCLATVFSLSRRKELFVIVKKCSIAGAFNSWSGVTGTWDIWGKIIAIRYSILS